MSPPPPAASASGASLEAPSRLRLALLLGALAALGPLSIDMYLPSFPSLARSLGTSVASVQLTLATYLAGVALGQLLYGPLSDRFGRRRPLLVGLGLYAVASVICAFASSLPLLAVARFVQALGGCAGMVISRAVVRDHFDERESARLYSSLILVMGVAPILAPILGGQVLAAAGWRAIFAVLAAVGIGVLTVIGLALPESLAEEARLRRSLGETFRAMGALLADTRFVRISVAGGGVQAALFAYIAGSPFVLIELYGVSAERYGLIFGANALGLIAASQLNRWLVPRVGVLRALRGAVLVSVVAYLGLWLGARSEAPLDVLLPALFVGMSSLGVALPNATAAAMAPYGRRAGIASAVLGTLQMGCGALAPTAVSALADGSARPMAAVMLGGAVVSLALLWPREVQAAA